MADQQSGRDIISVPNSIGGLTENFLSDVRQMSNNLSPPRRRPAPEGNGTREWLGLQTDPDGVNFPFGPYAGPYLVQAELFCMRSLQPGSLGLHRQTAVWPYGAGDDFTIALRTAGEEGRLREAFVVAAALNVARIPSQVARAPTPDEFHHLIISRGGVRLSGIVPVGQICDQVYANRAIPSPLHRLSRSSFERLKSELSRELARIAPELASAARLNPSMPFSSDSNETPGVWEGFVPGQSGPGPTSETCPAAALRAKHKVDETYWPQITAYLASLDDNKCPHVKCTFCLAELVCPPLQQPASDREPMLKLPCLHVVGKVCAQAWFSSQIQHGRAAQCPLCRSHVPEGIWKA